MRKRGSSGPVKSIGEKADDQGDENLEEEPKPVKARVKSVTFWQTFKGGLLSAPTIVLMAAIGMNIYGRREDTDQNWASWAAPLILLASMVVGSALVTKLENSEWRQNLRAEVAATEKKEMEKKGINQQDLNKAWHQSVTFCDLVNLLE